ncbi:hypothetical protein ATANTOWER_018728 [Ataeniobius toweri]|uniref:Ig-like domain-containing protein n=1 Tax=Ataeniobius toweri TaxID=208326 RepID=A0ABU7C2D6_9TELE|nr:hypothetical protein [Ataeniobius toweri]
MNLLWLTLLLLHQGYTLVPVTIVPLGSTATLKCPLPDEKQSSSELQWYKQEAGNTVKFIVKLSENAEPTSESELLDSRLHATFKEKISILTISNTIQEDEGMYHCALIDWNKNTWQGTYLLIKGNNGTSNYTVHKPKVSDPVHLGDSVTLQCSVLSDSEENTCSGDLKLYWVKAGDKSLQDIIYTDENRENKCEEKSDSQQRRVCNFSKTVSTSDAGTYYCAVATCGEIIFGNGTKVDFASTSEPEFINRVITITCLAISLIINIIFIFCKTPESACKLPKGAEATSTQAKQATLSQSTDFTKEEEHDLNYAALHFAGAKSTRGKSKREMKTEESVYSQMKL